MDRIEIVLSAKDDGEDFDVDTSINIDNKSRTVVIGYMAAIMEELAEIDATSFAVAAAITGNGKLKLSSIYGEQLSQLAKEG